MKKFLSVLLVGIVALSFIACGKSYSTQSSKTGQIKTKINETEVSLNSTQFTFPEGYTLKEGNLTDPLGISLVQVEKDDAIIGVYSDGKYTTELNEENLADCANAVYNEVHSMNETLDITPDLFLTGSSISILPIQLKDGYGIFIAHLGTKDFAYITESETDTEYVMDDCLKEIILQLGTQDDYDYFYGDIDEENASTDEETVESNE